MKNSVLVVLTDDLMKIKDDLQGAAQASELHFAGPEDVALSMLRDLAPGVVVVDLELPKAGAIALLSAGLRELPGTQFIVVSGTEGSDRAKAALDAGAVEHLPAPLTAGGLLHAIERASPVSAASAGAMVRPFRALIGSSDAMQTVQARLHTIAQSDATTLITGESGTGKGLCAEAIHARSERAKQPLIRVNCAALPPDMQEAEIFGYLHGTFAGAEADRAGAAARADGGTLFLDEITELATPAKARLLRLLETSEVVAIGATHSRTVNVRIVCTTSRDPRRLVGAGGLRADLYYRLNVLSLLVPPLRDRGEDVQELAQSALRQYAAAENRQFTTIASSAQGMMQAYSWPGNVRQLFNVIQNSVMLHDGDALEPHMLPDELFLGTGVPPGTGDNVGHGGIDPEQLSGFTLEEIERLAIDSAIQRHSGSIQKAAAELGVSPSTIYRKLAARKGND